MMLPSFMKLSKHKETIFPRLNPYYFNISIGFYHDFNANITIAPSCQIFNTKMSVYIAKINSNWGFQMLYLCTGDYSLLPHMSIKNGCWCTKMKETLYVSWKPRNGTIPKPEISTLFKSSVTRLNKILRVNLLWPFWIKLVCLKNKWSALCLIPSKTHSHKEPGGENRQCLHQPNPIQMDWLFFSSADRLHLKAPIPGSTKDHFEASAHRKPKLAQGWQHATAQ